MLFRLLVAGYMPLNTLTLLLCCLKTCFSTHLNIVFITYCSLHKFYSAILDLLSRT